MNDKIPGGPRITHTRIDSAKSVTIGSRANREAGRENVSQTIELAEGSTMKIEKPGGVVIEIGFKEGIATIKDRGIEKKYKAKKVEVTQGGGRHTIFLDGLELA